MPPARTAPARRRESEIVRAHLRIPADTTARVLAPDRESTSGSRRFSRHVRRRLPIPHVLQPCDSRSPSHRHRSRGLPYVEILGQIIDVKIVCLTRGQRKRQPPVLNSAARHGSASARRLHRRDQQSGIEPSPTLHDEFRGRGPLLLQHQFHFVRIFVRRSAATHFHAAHDRDPNPRPRSSSCLR